MLFVNPAIAALAFFIVGTTACAEQTLLKPLDRPDPAKISLPPLPLPSTETDRAGSDDYFYFQKQGVSYEVAFADLDQCRLYASSTKLLALPPKVVPLGTNIVTSGNVVVSPDGVPGWHLGPIGMMLASAYVASVEESNSYAITRRCMAYKGYKRFAVARSLFKKIDTENDTERLARWALVASGPQSPVEPVAP